MGFILPIFRSLWALFTEGLLPFGLRPRRAYHTEIPGPQAPGSMKETETSWKSIVSQCAWFSRQGSCEPSGNKFPIQVWLS